MPLVEFDIDGHIDTVVQSMIVVLMQEHAVLACKWLARLQEQCRFGVFDIAGSIAPVISIQRQRIHGLAVSPEEDLAVAGFLDKNVHVGRRLSADRYAQYRRLGDTGDRTQQRGGGHVPVPSGERLRP